MNDGGTGSPAVSESIWAPQVSKPGRCPRKASKMTGLQVCHNILVQCEEEIVGSNRHSTEISAPKKICMLGLQFGDSAVLFPRKKENLISESKRLPAPTEVMNWSGHPRLRFARVASAALSLKP